MKTHVGVCFLQLAVNIVLHVQEMFQSTRDYAEGLKKMYQICNPGKSLIFKSHGSLQENDTTHALKWKTN